MKRPISLKLSLSLLALSVGGSALSGSLSPAQIEQAAQRDVIVILRDQLAGAPPARESMESRASAVAASQASVIATLKPTVDHKVHSFQTINAFSARVSQAEATTLANHPAVQAVVPDRILRLKPRSNGLSSASAASGGVAPKAEWTSGTSDNGLCGTLEPEALQLTHTAFLDTSTPQAQEVVDGNGDKVTGKGVKVAWVADGIDTDVPGFIRPDGSHVFVDYQDFSGDPAGTPTAGGEAFLDASSIAAQDMPKGKLLTYDISQYVNQTHPLPSPCNIHIRGMAPGASLVGLKVFSNLGYTTTSSFVQAIEYAVVHDKVDVINESFGGNPYPDNNNDPITLADNAAIAAGVTVVVSSGDGGPTGTLGSPATSTAVISAGASTQFRSYVQTQYGAAPLANGYVSDNISALSSGGFAQSTARTVDVVAPGDLGWALCSSNDALYNDCTNYQTPAVGTPIQLSGGTSESAPLTSGEAALVIQAYRSTHNGASPSPAMVKKIIMSTATGLSNPAFEEGAGLINALKAVNTALSIGDAHGNPKPRGLGLLAGPTSALVEGEPGAHKSLTFTLTNEGDTTRQLKPGIEELSAFSGATLTVTLNAAKDPTFPNVTGSPRAYIEKSFTVPAGADHLEAAIAWQVSITSSATPIAYIGLLDPSGRQVAYSLPQGLASGYGHVDVDKPTPGKWTAVIWTRVSGTGAYSGPVEFTWTAERYVMAGSVHPSTLKIKPGESATFTADLDLPSQPGDSAAAIRFFETDGVDTYLPELPVSLRTLIPTAATGGSFTGTLTGGNGRADVAPYQTYEFDVPQGVNDMSLNFEIPDNGYLLEGLLIDPNGMQLSVEPNLDPFGDPQFGMSLFHFNPQPGRWRFALLTDTTISGNQTSLGFTARIGFNNSEISASLPDSANTKLSASAAPVTVAVSVTNSGTVTAAYFADARLNALSLTSLATQACDSFTTLPGTCSLYYVPTETSAVGFLAHSTSPITMDSYNIVGYNSGGTGNPDIYAQSIGSGWVLATLAEPEIPYGAWVDDPALIGPFGASGAPTAPVTTNAYVLAQPFDAAVSADSGDIWADLVFGTNTYNPLILAPGESGTITLTITPDATQVGNTISGYVYIDTFNPIVGTGDEVVRLPYTYTISK